MTWYYQLMRHTSDDEVWYEVHEMYNLENGQQGWTKEGVNVVADTPEGIKWVLNMMYKDIKEHGVIDYHD